MSDRLKAGMYIAVKVSDLPDLDLQSLGVYGATLKKYESQNNIWCRPFKVSDIFKKGKGSVIKVGNSNFIFYKCPMHIFGRLLFTKSSILKNFMPKVRLYKVFPGGKKFQMKNSEYHK